jgi:AmmeMemoRadiSam system protein A
VAVFEGRLSEEERAWLLAHARAAIAERFGTAPLGAHPPSAVLMNACGAFVSLHRLGELRGCIGTLARDRRLDEVVAEMAVAAAFHDPRFPPLEPEELDDLTLEISVIGPLFEARPEDVVPGVHGVSIAAEGRRAVYLPKVAIEAGWDRVQLLEETCLKAGLAPNGWRDPAIELSVFTAEVFVDSRASH